MPQLRITSLPTAIVQHADIRGFCLDSPILGPDSAGGILRIEGWALPKKHPLRGLQIFCQGALLRTFPLNRPRPDVAKHFPGAPENAGFSGTLTALELPPEFELQLVLLVGEREAGGGRGVGSGRVSGVQLPMGTLRGSHEFRGENHPELLRPLMITSRGRSGTTLLMRLLSQHPAIVADRTYPYETKALVHWLHLLRVLTQPQPSVTTAEPFDRGDWPIPPFVPPQTVASAAFAQYIAAVYPPRAAAFCLASADDFYRQIAAAQGQANPIYCCEKIPPNGLQIMAWNLNPATREIFLVRDFRDMLASVFAFNSKRGQVGFGRQHAASDEMYIHDLQEAVTQLLRSYQSRRDRATLVRYEDLVLHAEATLRPLLAYLELECSDAILAAMTGSAARDTEQLKGHRTSASPEQSIGRWQMDLSPALRKLAREAFDDLLPEFGYRLENDGRLELARE